MTAILALKGTAWPAHSQCDWVCNRYLMLGKLAVGTFFPAKAVVGGRVRWLLQMEHQVVIEVQARVSQTFSTSLMAAPWAMRSQFTLPGGDWMHVPAHAETAILQVLEGKTCAANQTRQISTGLLVTSLKLLPLWTARARSFWGMHFESFRIWQVQSTEAGAASTTWFRTIFVEIPWEATSHATPSDWCR